MARSLPENTVDAWTAIELARSGAPWIWLPTTNQGATQDGTHPGDISALLGRRLIVIESKGIEAEKSINFGSSASGQRAYLTAIEDNGLAGLDRHDVPCFGWVFYGLPLRAGAVSGSDWRGFPDWHHLICPHTLAHWGIGSSSTITNLRSSLTAGAVCHCCVPPLPPAGVLHLTSTPLTLGRLAYFAAIGLAGLPLAQDESGLLDQTRELVDDARAARSELLDVYTEPINEGGVLNLLQELASIVAGRGRNRVVGIL